MTQDPIRVLVVDDDEHVRRLHAGYIGALDGFVVAAVAGGGEAAVEIASRPDIDLVLLDIELPGFSGIEVLRRIRELRGGAVDVYVISATRDPRTVRQAASARVAGFLVKPFTREAFASRLAEYRASRASAPGGSEADVPLGQGEIDDLLAFGRSHTRSAPPADTAVVELPKGIAASTLDEIRDALDPLRPATVADIASATGASRATVRRYLDHLAHAGELDISHRFGRRGRPEVLYRLAVQPG
ncbi:response regulator [Microbacterium karelineae]|uniref:response regulator n=1 Tax=Microbacterium karelineae TaxID=2654283 RepID=UPI0012EA02D9|nr:response regulator [Microbacterium karelineae]